MLEAYAAGAGSYFLILMCSFSASQIAGACITDSSSTSSASGATWKSRRASRSRGQKNRWGSCPTKWRGRSTSTISSPSSDGARPCWIIWRRMRRPQHFECPVVDFLKAPGEGRLGSVAFGAAALLPRKHLALAGAERVSASRQHSLSRSSKARAIRYANHASPDAAHAEPLAACAASGGEIIC